MGKMSEAFNKSKSHAVGMDGVEMDSDSEYEDDESDSDEVTPEEKAAMRMFSSAGDVESKARALKLFIKACS